MNSAHIHPNNNVTHEKDCHFITSRSYLIFFQRDKIFTRWWNRLSFDHCTTNTFGVFCIKIHILPDFRCSALFFSYFSFLPISPNIFLSVEILEEAPNGKKYENVTNTDQSTGDTLYHAGPQHDDWQCKSTDYKTSGKKVSPFFWGIGFIVRSISSSNQDGQGCQKIKY